MVSAVNRGNGMLGLHNLVYFVRTFNAVCRSVVANYDSPAALPLAITSINMTTCVALEVHALCTVHSPCRPRSYVVAGLSWT